MHTPKSRLFTTYHCWSKQVVEQISTASALHRQVPCQPGNILTMGWMRKGTSTKAAAHGTHLSSVAHVTRTKRSTALRQLQVSADAPSPPANTSAWHIWPCLERAGHSEAVLVSPNGTAMGAGGPKARQTPKTEPVPGILSCQGAARTNHWVPVCNLWLELRFYKRIVPLWLYFTISVVPLQLNPEVTKALVIAESISVRSQTLHQKMMGEKKKNTDQMVLFAISRKKSTLVTTDC